MIQKKNLGEKKSQHSTELKQTLQYSIHLISDVICQQAFSIQYSVLTCDKRDRIFIPIKNLNKRQLWKSVKSNYKKQMVGHAEQQPIKARETSSFAYSKDIRIRTKEIIQGTTRETQN